MNLAAFAVRNRATVYFAYVIFAIAGAASFFGLGQLEDPEFAIKNAVISVSYPGASPEEIELEVVDRIEIALQELPQLDNVESSSFPGRATIAVEIKDQYWAPELPQIWDELRRKINDVRASLPPGVEEPVITDDFGAVFGFQLAVVGDGYTDAEIEGFAKQLRKELGVVEGVARADLWGARQKAIYLDSSETQLSEIGISDSSIENTLRQQNMIVDAGSVDVQERRLRISPTGEFRSPQDIGELTIRPTLADSMQSSNSGPGFSAEQSSELIRIKDIGTVRQGYIEPPHTMMRYNGRPAIGISITNLPGVNIVEVGRNIDARLAEILPTLPVGIEIRRVHWMSDIVDAAVQGFLVSFAQAVAIVLVVLTIFMGWRMSLIIGMALIMTILGTFILMAMTGTDLQRMSLGALIIALGMMVDNAIVVADGMVVRLKQGMDRTQAAIEAAEKPSLPLLGATVVAVMAFYPIFASVAGAGEYCRTLFIVVAMSLLTSWLVSVTLTPLQCIDMVPDSKDDEDGADPYAGGMFAKFRGLLEKAIRFRWLTIGGAAALLVVSGLAFGNVTQLFFPDSSMNKFMIDIYATKGTRIQQVATDLEAAEKKLMDDERVMEVAAFIGAGPPRFYLPVDPAGADQSYAQLIVNVHNFREIDDLISEVNPWLEEQYPDALVSVRKYGVGPSNTWAFEARISGPAIADPGELRSLAAEGTAVLENQPLAGLVRTDWRERVTRLEPQFAQERARWASVTRDDIARTTMRAFDGRTVGLYREGDDLLPIVLRLTDLRGEGRRLATIDTLQVQPEGSTVTIPMPQVTDGVPVAWEDPVIGRRDRRRTITIQANPVQGVTLPALRAAVVNDFDALADRLPPGYTMEWGGEYEDTVTAQESLKPGMVPMAIVILLIVVALFNAYRPPLVIFMTVPFAVIGMVWGMLLFNAPFGFVALLGAMSLIGMMIKNAIVLLDECNVQLDEGRTRYDAIIYAALSRLRPVVLAAATTVLGVVPLLKDVFWIGLAVVLMAGLTFGTILTMILVPVLYSTVYKLKKEEESAE